MPVGFSQVLALVRTSDDPGEIILSGVTGVLQAEITSDKNHKRGTAGRIDLELKRRKPQ